nr:pentapeptide repeat-containing protein [uncultured Actinoplanes sp.]
MRWIKTADRILVYRVIAVIGALAALVLIVWVLPIVLTRHPKSIPPNNVHKAITDTRGNLAQILAGIGLIGGLLYTARTYRTARDQSITDRFTKAVELLGGEFSLPVRVGGVFALERISRDSPSDHPVVMEVVCAYLREKSDYLRREYKLGTDEEVSPESFRLRTDFQAAVAVLRRRDSRLDANPLDLRGSVLIHADLRGADLRNANLRGADLRLADLDDADLTGADLTHAVGVQVRPGGTKAA